MEKNSGRNVEYLLGSKLRTVVSEIAGVIDTNIIAQAETTENVVSGTCGDKATWEYNRDTNVLTIGGSGMVEVDVFSNKLDNYKGKIKKVVIGDGITEISSYTFSEYTALEEVQFGSGVKKIGHRAFQKCTSLKNIELGGKIQEIGVCAFASCKNLTDVYIGKALKVVYWDVFKDCNGLSNIKIHEQNNNILVEGKTLKNANISGNCGKKTSSGTVGKKVKYTYNYKTKTLTISGTGDMYNGYETEDAGIDEEEEYYYNFLTESPDKKIIKGEMEKLVIKNGVTSIGAYAFEECTALKEVKIGSSVKVIEKYAFDGCTALKKINWTDKIEKIQQGAFYSCKKLAKLYVGKSVKVINDYAFSGCVNLKQIKVHKSNKQFSKRGNMLLNKQQTKLVLGCFASDTTCHIYNSVTSLNVNALTEENIKKFEVSSRNKKYASKNGLLYSKDGKTLYLCPRGKAGTATISAKATKISGISGSYAFQNCDKLKTM